MDDPGLEPARHAEALTALARINWISGSDRILWNPLKSLARSVPGRTLRVLDVATGGGDVPIRLWRRARQAGLEMEFHGTDISSTALEIAKKRARVAGAEVAFFRTDIQSERIPDGFDVLTCSLFLHHLSSEQALALLRNMRAAAGQMVLVNDLRRSRTGLLLAWLGTRLLTMSPVARVDGPLSVRAAFTASEVRTLAEQADMANAEVCRRWPCRFLLMWKHS
jgi:2-polyprenyl-3-methyl-5-hydroxy-6-metoxy-1,4-benzoquinol methylase